MKVVIQRALESSVISNGILTGKINKGMVILICFESRDQEQQIQKCVDKILSLRIFEDENRKMNYNVTQVNGEILIISQFTLAWNGQKGNRPSFDQSMEPSKAEVFFEKTIKLLSEKIKVEQGIFGADMKVSLINDGPVTFHLEF